ncbi:tyrosine-type recombinase/integrase [Amycolatopsis roodepoortensis]|uniref:tyrosine-type recombinase/integrase n=1 Tax=Amycolatopsis roodepoortensis TaxID=700274 RepID=UPI00214AC834|nr:site-specific integrase [Amycolatopsis roodepoortensis]UUV32043.1 tyrosine-type recombinase/integrase [Amycolatopsis roodepoortensis]
MAYIEDRWMRQKRDPVTRAKLVDNRGNPLMERTDRYGSGQRYRVRWIDKNQDEQSLAFPDKALTQAREFADKVGHAIRSGAFIDPRAGDITVTQWAKVYVKGRSQDESSQLSLNSLISNQVLPFLGNYSLNEVDETEIREYKHWLANHSTISINYQADAWETSSLMFDAAVDARKIDRNPFNSKSIPGPKRQMTLITPWPESKMHAVEHGLSPRGKISVPLGAGLGLRIGEMLAFSPDFIDRDRMLYRCARQLIYRTGVLKFKLPKGHKERDIPISAGLLQRIDEYCDVFEPVEVTLPWAERDGVTDMTVRLMITNASNGPWRASMWTDEVWKQGFRDGGVEYRPRKDGTHALRHLYASYLLSQGVSIKELAAFLGHTSEGFTLKRYVHLLPSGYDRARLAVDAMFPPTRILSAVQSPSRVRIAGRRAAGIRRPN